MSVSSMQRLADRLLLLSRTLFHHIKKNSTKHTTKMKPKFLSKKLRFYQIQYEMEEANVSQLMGK
jgi:hypothetical protein